VLETGEHHVVCRPTTAAEGVDAIDERIERGAFNHSQCVGVIVIEQMATDAALIAEIGKERVTQVVLDFERVMFDVLGGEMARQAAEVGAAGCG